MVCLFYIFLMFDFSIFFNEFKCCFTDGSSSEMELQLVNAAIQRATAESSSSENESTSQDVNHSSTTHYASSLLQQFVTQTQLLSHTNNITPLGNTINQLNPSVSNIGCTINSAVNKTNLNNCSLPPSISGINHLSSNFLSNDQSQPTEQPLSRVEELSQINKDLAELTSTTDIDISIPNPPCLDECVSNNDLTAAVSSSSSEIVPKHTIPKVEPTNKVHLNSISNASKDVVESENKTSDVKRKRGRPRKIREELIIETKSVSNGDNLMEINNIIVNEFGRNNDPPNVSPDSGILSNHNSPTHSPSRRIETDDSSIKVLNCKPSIKNNTIKRSSRSKSKSRIEACNRDRSISSETTSKQKNFIDSNEKKKCELLESKIENKTERKKTEKLDIAALDRMLYATDRVLYPPRRKVGRPPLNKNNATKKGPGRPPKNKPLIDSGDSDDDIRTNKGLFSEVYAKRKDINKLVMSKKCSKNMTNWRDNQSDYEGPLDESLDPMWREIDLNPKYRDILSGYKSDYEVKSFKICSRLIESGYKSDYGFKSGYKSDHCSRSGYKSDHKSGYKSDKSGYKSDYSIRNIRRKMRKLKKSRSVRDRNYYKNQKYFVSDQEIILLANKTLSCLTLGHSTSDSDSENRSQKSYLPSKFTNPKSSITSSKFTFGANPNRLNPLALSSANNIDLFAPAPVFSNLGSRISSNLLGYNNIFNTSNRFNFNKTNKHSFGSMFPSTLSVFTHKFGCTPISTTRNETFSIPSTAFGRDVSNNNNTLKQTCRNTSPKVKKSAKTDSIYPIFKKEKSPLPVSNLFQQTQSTYVPSKSLSRNIFLNFKKPPVDKKSSNSHWKKHKTQIIISPTKSQNLKSSGRLSRMSIKSVDSKHHKHKLKKHKRQRRSRSVSRSREICTKSVSGTVDQKFSQEMENLISHFVKLLHTAPKSVSQQSSKSSSDKIIPENILKCVKRTSKKRKGPDNPETSTPTTKRRHKKQLLESQSKGGKDKDTSANEHKLPLKKRHYHINSSTNNSLSLSLVATEFVDDLKTESSKGSDAFVCTETDCLGDLNDDSTIVSKTPIKNSSNEKSKKDLSTCKIQDNSINSTQPDLNKSHCSNNMLSVNIDESVESCNSQHISPCSTGTDDELIIQKPAGEHSEFSKKIYETSEKLKAVHKMVHDLEKCLPKGKDVEVGSKESKSSCNSPSNTSTMKNSAPIVTPKKRHRLEADRIANSSLDMVVQSLSKKLSEDRLYLSDKNNFDENSKSHVKNSDSHSSKHSDDGSSDSKKDDFSNSHVESVKSKGSNKHMSPPTHKSEIITRKKNRLEGLTSNLVSKINPNSASKVLDTLMSNNLRKSIESRIVERNKTGSSSTTGSSANEKLSDHYIKDIVNRATVIKSPISKLKLPAEAKKLPKGTDILIEETVVVNVEKPTGIFEPSVDIELQIPKSSISLNHISVDSTRYSKLNSKTFDSKVNGKISKCTLESESRTGSNNSRILECKSKKGDSIISVISDKIENGHNLRQSIRVQTVDCESKSTDDNDKRKKKSSSNILKESKLKLPQKLIHSKHQTDMEEVSRSDSKIYDLENNTVLANCINNFPANNVSDSSMPLKKRAKRRKAINRTGFPTTKKKKKKTTMLSSNTEDILSDTNSMSLSDNTKTTSAFDRVPKVGETTTTFLERTGRKKQGELKVILNKDECPKQGRVSVVALEKLQAKNCESNSPLKSTLSNSISDETGIINLNNVPNDQSEILDTVAKWEVLSETDSLPPLSGSIGNDPEDSIPLSLLNLKAERPNSRIDVKGEKLKRKLREISPCDSIDSAILSKRSGKSKSKNNPSHSDMSLRKTGENREPSYVLEDDDIPLSAKKIKLKSNSSKDNQKSFVKEKSPNENIQQYANNTSDVARISSRRKSRSCNTMKRLRDISPSSRDSSLETMKSIKKSPKSRDTSVETIKHLQDNCLENDPLPIQEKEIDFEKSIDILSKNIISKKRIMSSRDDSPASSVERGYRSEREKSYNHNRNPRTRKKYLVAGLFSNYYKEIE